MKGLKAHNCVTCIYSLPSLKCEFDNEQTLLVLLFVSLCICSEYQDFKAVKFKTEQQVLSPICPGNSGVFVFSSRSLPGNAVSSCGIRKKLFELGR